MSPGRARSPGRNARRSSGRPPARHHDTDSGNVVAAVPAPQASRAITGRAVAQVAPVAAALDCPEHTRPLRRYEPTVGDQLACLLDLRRGEVPDGRGDGGGADLRAAPAAVAGL